MDFTLTTPGLLFSAISLLLLAYTNRFLAIAALIRSLYPRYKTDPSDRILGQLKNLRRRLQLIRYMQALGVSSFFLCVLCMAVLFYGFTSYGKMLFGGSLLFLMASLILSVAEIQISVNALNLELSDLEEIKQKKRG